jgi:hypothetical protein
MLRAKELIDAREQLDKCTRQAEELLLGITPENIVDRMNKRSTVMVRIEHLKRRLRGTSDVTLPMNYKITPVCRIII